MMVADGRGIKRENEKKKNGQINQRRTKSMVPRGGGTRWNKSGAAVVMTTGWYIETYTTQQCKLVNIARLLAVYINPELPNVFFLSIYTIYLHHAALGRQLRDSIFHDRKRDESWGNPLTYFVFTNDTYTLVFSLLTKRDNFCLKYLTHTERNKVFVAKVLCCTYERRDEQMKVIRELNDLSQPHIII